MLNSSSAEKRLLNIVGELCQLALSVVDEMRRQGLDYDCDQLCTDIENIGRSTLTDDPDIQNEGWLAAKKLFAEFPIGHAERVRIEYSFSRNDPPPLSAKKLLGYLVHNIFFSLSAKSWLDRLNLD